MKILHTSDLHIGKRIYETSMYDEQHQMLNRIIQIAKEEMVDAIILAGDIYDKNIPSEEAVAMLDEFFTNLAQLKTPVFIISGNHDSDERLAFGSKILEASRFYISPVYDGHVKRITLPDGQRVVDFYLLPFVKPSMVQKSLDDDTVELKTYDAAVRYAVGRMDIDPSHTNILITHQFITGANRTESEDQMVGGIDNISADAFEQFDYVALGHLHRPQYCQCDSPRRTIVRYSGTPLKYSFSEINDTKSVSLVEVDADGELNVREVPLGVGREWFDLRGKYEELTAKSYYEGKGYQEGYVRITLTDEEDILDGMRRLKAVYPHLLELRYDNKRTQQGLMEINGPKKLRSPLELFDELFQKQNGQAMAPEQTDYITTLINDIFPQN